MLALGRDLILDIDLADDVVIGVVAVVVTAGVEVTHAGDGERRLVLRLDGTRLQRRVSKHQPEEAREANRGNAVRQSSTSVH